MLIKDFSYLGLNAKSAALYDHRLLGELFKQILPLAGQLAKCAFGHEKYPPGEETTQQRVRSGINRVQVFRSVVFHSPLGDHQEVRVIDLGMSEVSVLGKTSILNFLRGETK